MDDTPDQAAAVAYLASLKPGFLPLPIFLEIARLSVLAFVELVPVRRNDDGALEVLLLERPEEDVWSGMWHTPGTGIRSGERMDNNYDYAAQLDRLLGPDGELAGIQIVGSPVQVGCERRRTLRGDELAVVFYVEVAGEPPIGRFFRLADFPGNVPAPGVMPHHIPFIKRTADAFIAGQPTA